MRKMRKDVDGTHNGSHTLMAALSSSMAYRLLHQYLFGFDIPIDNSCCIHAESILRLALQLQRTRLYIKGFTSSSILTSAALQSIHY